MKSTVLLFPAALIGVLLASTGGASAQLPPILNDRYRIDLHQGPVMGNSRVNGLGGAYVAVAEKSVGIPFNPASVANRSRPSGAPFRWELGGGLLYPGLSGKDHFDFDNNGRSISTEMFAFNVGGRAQFGSLGAGIYGQGQHYRFETGDASPRRFTADVGLVQFPAALALYEHQLVLGSDLRVGFLNIEERGPGGNGLDAYTLGIGFGALYRPTRWPIRLGMSYSTPLTSEVTVDKAAAGTPFHMPSKGVGVSWEFRLGAAFCAGRRLFNAPDAPPHPKRTPAGEDSGLWKGGKNPVYLDSFFVLISLELAVYGPVKNASGMDGLLQQVLERSGRHTNWSPRLGIETEIWPRRVRFRMGVYWEPSRFEGNPGRIHGTFALEIRLFEVKFLGLHTIKFSTSMDVARRYSDISFSFGVWD